MLNVDLDDTRGRGDGIGALASDDLERRQRKIRWLRRQ